MRRDSSYFHQDRDDRRAREVVRLALQLMDAEAPSGAEAQYRHDLRQAAVEAGIAPEFLDRALGRLEERAMARHRRRIAMAAMAGLGLVGVGLIGGLGRVTPAPVALPISAPAPSELTLPPPMFPAPFHSKNEWKILLIDQQKARY